jgi:hypothetical protein
MYCMTICQSADSVAGNGMSGRVEVVADESVYCQAIDARYCLNKVEASEANVLRSSR